MVSLRAGSESSECSLPSENAKLCQIFARCGKGLPSSLDQAFQSVGGRIFGTCESELREILRAVLPRGGVAFDIGAKVGWHKLLKAHLAAEVGHFIKIDVEGFEWSLL